MWKETWEAWDTRPLHLWTRKTTTELGLAIQGCQLQDPADISRCQKWPCQMRVLNSTTPTGWRSGSSLAHPRKIWWRTGRKRVSDKNEGKRSEEMKLWKVFEPFFLMVWWTSACRKNKHLFYLHAFVYQTISAPSMGSKYGLSIVEGGSFGWLVSCCGTWNSGTCCSGKFLLSWLFLLLFCLRTKQIDIVNTKQKPSEEVVTSI